MRLGATIHVIALAIALSERAKAPANGQHQREATAQALGYIGELDARLPRAANHGYVLLCPDCGEHGAYKQWMHWNDLADALLQRGYGVRWCGTSDGDLPALIERVAHAALVIGVDSGPVHLADLLSVPVIGLYAATSTESYGPYCDRSLCVDKHREAWALCKAGAYDSSRHINDARAMAFIRLDDVLAQVDAAMRRVA